MRFLVVTIISLVLFSVDALAQHAYFPLKKGAEMEYELGAAFRSPNNTGYSIRMKVMEESQTIGEHDYIVVESRMGENEENEVVEHIYFRSDQDGNLVSTLNDGAGETVALPADEELGKGTDWEIRVGAYTFLYEVVEMDGKIKTPNGNYKNCMVVEQRMESYTIKSYYQKNVGMVATTALVNGEELLQQYIVE